MIEGVAQFCISCQEICTGTRCNDCAREYSREHRTNNNSSQSKRNRADRHGARNTQWKRLSKEARKLQPWCSACLQNKADIEARGDRLETDHSREAYEAEQAHRPVSLQMVTVLCGQCNRAAGAAKDRELNNG